jgi:hypothetical protein
MRGHHAQPALRHGSAGLDVVAPPPARASARIRISISIGISVGISVGVGVGSRVDRRQRIWLLALLLF